MARERIEEVALLRALAFLAIVMQHSIAEYIYRADILQPDAVMLGMLFHFTRFGTPTFVFLSGVILFYNYTDKLDYGSYARKRFKEIFAPFLVWTVIYWATISLVMDYSFADLNTWRELGRQLLKPTYGYHLWFILMIFQFYLLLPWLLKLAAPLRRLATGRPDRAFQRTVWLLVIAAAAYGVLMWFSYYRAGAAASAAGGLWEWLLVYRNMWFVFYFFYFMLGAVCAYGLARFREAAVRSLVWNGLLFIGLYVWIGYELLGLSMQDMKLGASTYLRPITFVLIVSQLLAAYGAVVVLDRHGGVFKKMLAFVGKHSFGGFLAHAYILMFVSFYTRQVELAGYHLPAAVLTFVVVAAASIGLSKAASLVPFGWLLVGSQGRWRRKPTAGTGAGG
ncbi:acyltransferase [Paenibacillus darwinianus]|uniref:Acyltransferase n=1 Tax=Paenibacillus darwinianus TaxID=1380763 RepID=A0A9W5W7B6_9BACL|nr:acyltransferase [Paenibacillus darwinianus]EXX87917.1 acyltransferase [Paenibacillus darwinianus]EXX88266.1 acyltransferase [Paenibacillus darwinianus]EXX89138.1 acyltransferase [Paenibacillus darwinianus]